MGILLFGSKPCEGVKQQIRTDYVTNSKVFVPLAVQNKIRQLSSELGNFSLYASIIR